MKAPRRLFKGQRCSRYRFDRIVTRLLIRSRRGNQPQDTLESKMRLAPLPSIPRLSRAEVVGQVIGVLS